MEYFTLSKFPVQAFYTNNTNQVCMSTERVYNPFLKSKNYINTSCICVPVDLES